MFRTRVFELAREAGLTDSRLAERMGISQPLISRVRAGEVGVGRQFILGALRAFPEHRRELVEALTEEAVA